MRRTTTLIRPKAKPANGPQRELALIGGGQLASMLVEAAHRLGYSVGILDPDPACPAAAVADRSQQGSYDDPQALARIAKLGQLLTLELEAPPAPLLQALAESGIDVQPSPQVLGVLQDKLEQRRFFSRCGLPQPRFSAVQGSPAKAVAAFGGPCVLKARRLGYDGRGVLMPKGPQDPALDPWKAPALLEEKLRLSRELAVIVVRSRSGASVVYDPVEMRMHAGRHNLDAYSVPARVPAQTLAQARGLAVLAVEALGGFGAFGVELFVDLGGKVLLNEVSPRVHNSGHHSIEACETSQFENHWRAVLGLELGSPALRRPAATVNLYGPEGLQGRYRVEGLAAAQALPGVHVHLYGKAEARPGRKLGHLTALALDPAAALALARQAARSLRFVEAR
jgi:5-(carboxyamino)imidazole ribonucleotide synthase